MTTGRTRVLIDAGLSRRELARRLQAIGEDIDCLDAVVLTHEHCDHVSGLVALTRKASRRLPVFATAPCRQALEETLDWGSMPPHFELFQAGTGFAVGDVEIGSFTIPHDAADPVGFTVCSGGIKLELATDLGYVTDSLRVHLRGADLVVLESNHDLEMLRVGPYPWPVKQRVMSRRGHLSNEVAAEFLRQDLDTYTSTVVLGHISEHNNHPELVRHLAAKAIQRPLFTRLVVAMPGVQSEVFSF